MLTDPFTQPEKNIYALGGRILRLINISPTDAHDPDQLFRQINGGLLREQRVSWAYFHLALDWLYLLGKIEPTNTGAINHASR